MAGKDPRLDDPGILFPQSKNKRKVWIDPFPDSLKFRILAALVASSEARATALLDAVKKSPDAGKGEKGKAARASNDQFTLPNLISLEKSFSSAEAPTKNGNHCKAPIMIAQ